MERRLAAILLADLVGSSRLMGLDEEGTIARQKAHREEIFDPKISAHGGRIVKTTGDGLLVEFPSVVDAVSCAIEVQRELAGCDTDEPEDRRIQYRIGINLGDIVIDGDDILGDGVNVAARLENLAEPGGICISSNVFEQVRTRVDAGFADIGQQRVKNIAEPIRVYRLMLDGTSGAVVGAIWERLARSRLGAALGILILVSGVVLLGLWYVFPIEKAIARKLSLVVLPFTNLSGDKSQDYFADAVTEDLITDLSRIRGAFVIARGTSFTYKGKPTDARQVARDLDVLYVLEGSVRRSGNQVRVNTQLIEGSTGVQLWSDKFDRELKDTLAVQSAITGRIASVLRAELLEAESRRVTLTNLEAWDYATKGFSKVNDRETQTNYAEALLLFEKSLELDPKLTLAWEGVAFIHYVAATRRLAGVEGNHLKLTLDAAKKAVQFDKDSSGAQSALG